MSPPCAAMTWNATESPSPGAAILRRKERLEDVGEIVCRDAHAGIADGDPGEAPGIGDLAFDGRPCLQRQGPARRFHRVARIQREIDEDLRQLRTVTMHEEPIGRHDFELNAAAEQGPEFVGCLPEESRHVDGAEDDLRRPAEAENVGGEPFAPFQRSGDDIGEPQEGRIVARPAPDCLGDGLDAHEHVVELVRDLSGEAPKAGERLGKLRVHGRDASAVDRIRQEGDGQVINRRPPRHLQVACDLRRDSQEGILLRLGEGALTVVEDGKRSVRRAWFRPGAGPRHSTGSWERRRAPESERSRISSRVSCDAARLASGSSASGGIGGPAFTGASPAIRTIPKRTPQVETASWRSSWSERRRSEREESIALERYVSTMAREHPFKYVDRDGKTRVSSGWIAVSLFPDRVHNRSHDGVAAA